MDKLSIVELFSGCGSQTQALKNIGVEHDVIGISDWEVNALISYDAIHTDDGIDYTKELTKIEVLDYLSQFTFSTDGKESCNINRVKESRLRQLYNAHKRSKNLGSIVDIKELPYCDLLTYSSPCQDFSIAGKQEGGVKGSGTRSGLLWEVERLLNNMEVKPKYLLLENVKNLVSKKFLPSFNQWLSTLEELGYHNYWQVLNGKDYGIPQNRERVFVVSIRNDILFSNKNLYRLFLPIFLIFNIFETSPISCHVIDFVIVS